MTKAEYFRYVQNVTEFLRSEGITNLSTMGENYFSWFPCECCKRPQAGVQFNATCFNHSTNEIFSYSICVDCIYFIEFGKLDDQTMLDIQKSMEMKTS